MTDFVVLFLICVPLFWWYLLSHKYKCLDKIPGPKPFPFVGNALDIGKSPQGLFLKIVEYFEQYGDTFKLYLGSEPRIFTTRPELLEKIMNSNVHTTKSDGYDLLQPWINEGLLTSKGKKWKTRRKMIQPCFHSKFLGNCLETFNSSSEVLTQKLSQEVAKGPFDVHPYINLFALDVICETSMGVKVASQEGRNLDYVQAIKDYLSIVMMRYFSPWQRFDTLFKFSSNYKLYKRSLDILQTYSDDIIAKRRAIKLKEGKETLSKCGNGKKLALLDMLLESEDVYNLSHEDIKEEINTFLFGGHDTSSSVICFSLLTLAENQKVQDRVYDEILSVVEEDEYVTMEHLNNTKYLDMVLKEVLRMYPGVSFIERRLDSDLNIDGMHFPKGLIVSMCLHGVHRNKKYFPNPDKFDPDRFLPENQSKLHHYAYVPFSAGPRNCIGQKFGWLEMKTILIKILQRFQVLPVPNFKPELGMTGILKSLNGISIRLERRHE